ncbi:MAG TPA: hypothetical protein VIK61_07140 [Acidimicrobiia bacterium]
MGSAVVSAAALAELMAGDVDGDEEVLVTAGFHAGPVGWRG